MEVFAETLLREFIDQLPQVFAMVSEFKGQIASEGLKLVFLPLREFSLVSCIVAVGWIAIFWRNKSWILSIILNFKTIVMEKK